MAQEEEEEAAVLDDPALSLGPFSLDDLLPGGQGARVVTGQVGSSMPQLYGTPADALRTALTSGFAEVERYRRVWRLGRLETVETPSGQILYGRLGYQAREGETSVWNEATRDWEQQPVPRGETVTFAIRLTDLRIAFQIRPPSITVGGFIGAMEALLNRQEPERPWVIELGTSRPAYRAWRGTVSRVVRARGHLELPNPHWQGREKLESFFENFQLDEASVNLHFDPDAPQEAVDDVVTQMVDHAERGYGSAVIVGEVTHNGARAEYRTEVEQTPKFVPSDEHGEATSEGLAGLLDATEEVTPYEPGAPPTG